MENRLRGSIYMILCVVMWATSVIVCKKAIGDIHFSQFVVAEIFGMTVINFLFCWGSPGGSAKISRRHFRPLIVISFLGSVLGVFAWFYGLQMTKAINATCIAHTQIFFIAFLSRIQLKETLTIQEAFAGLFFLASALFIGARSLDNLRELDLGNRGDFLALVAAILWSLCAVKSKALMSELKGPTIAAYRGLIAFVFVVLFNFFYWGHLPIWEGPLVLFGLLVGFGFLFYYLALQNLRATQVGVLELTTPFFLLFLAKFYLDEIPTPLQLVGVFLLIPGFIFLIKNPLKKIRGA